MKHYLEELPLNWGRKETRDLRDLLVDIYPYPSRVEGLAKAVHMSPGTIRLQLPGRYLWGEFLGKARNAARHYALLLLVIDSAPERCAEQPHLFATIDPGAVLVQCTRILEQRDNDQLREASTRLAALCSLAAWMRKVGR